MTDNKDWIEWHKKYSTNVDLAMRLESVQKTIRSSVPHELHEAFKVIDICAGDGRDLIGALESHVNRDRISGLLVEISQSLADKARSDLLSFGLNKLNVICSDASRLELYENFIPADLILVCGVFGNIRDKDIKVTIEALPMLCRSGSKIIWTRNRRSPDKTPYIRELFAENEFNELDFISPDESGYAVVVNEYTGATMPFNKERKLFTFIRE